jgi:hypothetical protein
MRLFTTFVALLCLFAAGIAAACGTQHAEKTETSVATVTGPSTTALLTFVDSAILTIPRPTGLTETSKKTAAKPTATGCLFSIIEQAGSESACVDSAGDCHAYAYTTMPPKRDLVLKELRGASARRVCRDLASFQKPR